MNLVYPQLNHIGMIVRDIDQAAKENAGRFRIAGINRRFTLHVQDGIYLGKKVSYSAEFGFVDLGNTQLELIQPPGNNPSPYLDSLNEKGENTHHLAFVVSSIQQHLDSARKLNPALTIVLDASISGTHFVYVDGLIHGTLVELIEYTENKF